MKKLWGGWYGKLELGRAGRAMRLGRTEQNRNHHTLLNE